MSLPFKDVLLEDVYTKNLTTIAGIKFTRREIDIIAFLIRGRSAKKIGAFFSLSPKTVENYTRNIMIKLECNSKESIIDFIEQSGQFSYLKKYYTLLLRDKAFEKALRSISSLKENNDIACALVCGQGNHSHAVFMRRLDKHLKLVGFQTSFEIREHLASLNQLKMEKKPYQNDVVMFYGVSHSLFNQAQAELNPQGNKQSSFPENIYVCEYQIFLCLEADKNQEIAEKEENQSYYDLVFEILKILLPRPNFESVISEFKNADPYHSQESLQNPPSLTPLSHKGKSQNPVAFGLKNINQSAVLCTFLGAGLLLALFLIVRQQSFNNFLTPLNIGKEGDVLVRSDLALPSHTALLQRPELLQKMTNCFNAQPEGIRTLALVGIGGSGKTTLARQYARQQQASIVWEINAETKNSLIASFENLAHTLARTEEEKKEIREIQETKVLEEREQKLVRFVRDRFRAHPHWILIYDNAEQFEDIQKYFPQDQKMWGRGKVLVTTRNSHNNTYVNCTLSIEPLEADEKLKLFIKIINGKEAGQLTENEKVQARQFLSKIPSFPLDISAAAYYIKATNAPYETYLKHLQDYNKDFELIQGNLLKEASEYTKTRYRIITLSIRNIININKEFKDLLLLVSLLDSQDIPREFLVSYKGDMLVDSFIYNLKKYSLIMGSLPSNSSGGSFFSLHRSIQSIILTYLTKNFNGEKDRQLIKDITHVVEENIASALRKADAVLIKLSIFHGNSFLSHSNLINSYMSGLIESEIGRSYLFFGDYIKAKTFLEESYAKLTNNAHEKNYGKIARVLAYMGISYKILGDYGKSKAFLKKSLSIYANHLPKPNKDSIMAASFLGEVYRECGAYEEARILLEESLLTCRKYFSDSKDEDIPRIMVHLGVVYRDIGDYEKAKAFLTQGYTIFKERYPEKHTGIAMASTFLGDVYRRLQKYEEAEELLNQALIIYKSLFSDKHLSIARINAYLGNLYKDLGNYKKSKLLFQQALALYETHFGNNHIATAQILRDFGKVCVEDRSLEDAEELLNRSLKIFLKSEHPESYISLENLAELSLKKFTLAMKRGDVQEAQKFKQQEIEYMRQALEITQCYFPEDSPHVTRIQNKISSIFLEKASE